MVALLRATGSMGQLADSESSALLNLTKSMKDSGSRTDRQICVSSVKTSALTSRTTSMLSSHSQRSPPKISRTAKESRSGATAAIITVTSKMESRKERESTSGPMDPSTPVNGLATK